MVNIEYHSELKCTSLLTNEDIVAVVTYYSQKFSYCEKIKQCHQSTTCSPYFIKSSKKRTICFHASTERLSSCKFDAFDVVKHVCSFRSITANLHFVACSCLSELWQMSVTEGFIEIEQLWLCNRSPVLAVSAHFSWSCAFGHAKVIERESTQLRQLHWLPVQYRITFKLCLLMHKMHTNRAPSYLTAVSYTHLTLPTNREV